MLSIVQSSLPPLLGLHSSSFRVSIVESGVCSHALRKSKTTSTLVHSLAWRDPAIPFTSACCMPLPLKLFLATRFAHDKGRVFNALISAGDWNMFVWISQTQWTAECSFLRKVKIGFVSSLKVKARSCFSSPYPRPRRHTSRLRGCLNC